MSDSESRPTRWWQLLLRPWAIFFGAGVVALAGLLVNEYGPDLLERATDAKAVNIAAGYDDSRYDDGWRLATSETIEPDSAPPPGSTCDDARRWASNIGGVYVGESWVQMLIQGRSEGAVVVRSIHARIIDRSKPTKETLVFCESAGSQESVGIGFDLDKDNPVARQLNKDGGLGRPYFEDKVVTVAQAETVAFNIVGRTKKSRVTWVLDLHLVVDGEEEVVTAGGEGFQTTAAVTFRETWSWAWYKTPSRLVNVGAGE